MPPLVYISPFSLSAYILTRGTQNWGKTGLLLSFTYDMRLKTYCKGRITPGRIEAFRTHGVDDGARGPLVEPGAEVGEGLARALGPELDIPIVQVADPADEAERLGLPLGPVAEAYSLDRARDEGPECPVAAIGGFRGVRQQEPPGARRRGPRGRRSRRACRGHRRGYRSRA